MDAHRIEIFHIAYCDAGVGAVPHHLILHLFPTHQTALEQDLMNRARLQSALHDPLELFFRLGDAATSSPEGIRGSDYKWQTKVFAHQVGPIRRGDRTTGENRLAK